MSFHTVALTTSSQASTYTAIPAVLDPIFPPSGNGLLMPSDLSLVAAYHGSATAQRARVTAPSLLRVGYQSIRPVQQSAKGAPVADPNFATFLDRPIRLRASEAVGVEGASTSTERAVALLWIADQLEPAPPGEAFTLRFTSATALTGVFGWSMFAPVYDQATPSGVYGVIGLELFSTTAYAARVVFPGSVFRPGVLAQQTLVSTVTAGNARTASCFYDGSLGLWGTFQTNAPPNIEVFTEAADGSASVEGYLKVVRLGDVGAPASWGTGPSGPSGGYAAPGMTRAGAAAAATPGSLIPQISVAPGYGPGNK